MAIAVADEHQQLRASVRRWLDMHCSPAQLRAMLDDAEAFSTFWHSLGSAGWLGTHINEEFGGQGFGSLEVAIVLEELGRALAPGPILTCVLAGLLLQESASRATKTEFLPALADGTTIATVALADTKITGREVEGGYELNGSVNPVVGARHASLICLRVSGSDEWYVVEIDDCVADRLNSIDPTRHVWSLRLDSVFVPYERRLKNLTTARVRDVAATLAAAEACGIAAWSVDVATEYAKVREQFGHPIGKFQAVKHRCADMLCRLEQAACAAWDAACALDDQAEAPVSAAVAGLFATESAFACTKDCIQTLGGIGYTWDHDAHFYLKRATALRQLLGGPSAWSVEIARRQLAGGRRHLRINLPEESEAVRDEVREFLDEISDLDDAARRRRLADDGYIGAHWPKPWGQDADPVRQLVIQEEFRAARTEIPVLLVGAWIVPTLTMWGTKAQQDWFIPPTLYGEIQWCQMFSEPDAGSDLAALTTKAARVPGGWRLTGQKVWTTIADYANFAICLARTDTSLPKREGIGYFLVDMSSPGIDVRPLRELTGLAGFNEVFLNDVFVKDDWVVGKPTDGWKIARSTLANERVAMSADSTSMGLPELLLQLVEASGRVDDSLVLDGLGRLLGDAHTLALLQHRKMLTALRGAEPGPESSVHKLLHMEHNQVIAEWALEIFGPAATAREGYLGYWVDLFLGTRASTIAGGTSEVQRNLIAERILGLPHD